MVGYIGLLLLRQAPEAAARPAPQMPVPTMRPPERLPRRPSFAPASASIFRGGAPTGVQPLRIELRGLPAAIAPEAGVAIYDAVMDVQLEWLPLAGLERRDGTLQLATTAPAVPLRIALAASQTAARHGWYRTLLVPAERDAAAPVVVAADMQTVTVHLGGRAREHQDLRLRRTDDAAWRPFAIGPRLMPDAQGDLVLTLGPGDYELSTWTSAADQALRIAIPGPAELTAPFAAVRVDRL